MSRRQSSDVGFSLGLALFSLLPRLFVAIAWAREPVWDGHYYHFGATRIAEGFGYSEDAWIAGQLVWKPWCHYPVGYSGLLGGVYKLFGSSLVVAPVVNAVVGALTVFVVHRLAHTWLERRRARIAGVLCAFHPGLILYTALVMTEALAAFTLVLAGLLAVTYRTRWLGAVTAGAALGFGALVRPTALLALPLLAWVFPFRGKRTLLAVGIGGVTALSVVLPWTFRNCRVMDGCALISTNGGWNLAIGALTKTGRFTTLTANDGCPVVTGQVQQDRCWGEVGWQRIREAPGAWLSLIPQKLAHTYNHESFAVGYLAEANPELWTPEHKEQVRAATTVFHHLLMAGAALGAIAWTAPRVELEKLLEKARSASWKQSIRKAREWFGRSSLGDLVPRGFEPRKLVQPLLLLTALGWLVVSLLDPAHPFFWLIVVAPVIPFLRLPMAPRAGPAGYYCFGLVLLTTATHAVFFGDDRYHMTISPVLCILAAAMLRRPALSVPTSVSNAS